MEHVVNAKWSGKGQTHCDNGIVIGTYVYHLLELYVTQMRNVVL